MKFIRNLTKALIGSLPFFWMLTILSIVFYFLGLSTLALSVIIIAAIFLLVVSTPWLPEYFLKKLERKYPYLQSLRAIRKDKKNVLIHILGAGYSSDSRLSCTANLHLSSTYRIVEGLRLYNKFKNSKFVLTGGGVSASITSAKLHSNALKELGVPSEDIITINNGWNTYGEAKAFQKILYKNHNIVLVTDAVHMPRAIGIFNSLNLHPIPAPTNYRLRQNKHHRDIFDYFPSSNYINYTELVLNHYFGYIWMKLAKDK